MTTRTYLSTVDGFALASNPDIVLPYHPTDPPPTKRFFADPGPGNMYLGTSTIIAGRESYMGQRFGIQRTYWNIGTVEAGNGSGYQAAITQAADDVAAGRVPWLSFKLTTSGSTHTFDATWVQATAGTVDSRIIQILDGIVAATGGKGPVWITWHHEPNGDGVASQYLAMNRHMQDLMSDYPSILQVGAVLSAGYYQMNAGGVNAADWMQSDSCDIFGLDIYNPWSPTNGKQFVTVDQAFRLGGIAECLAIDPDKPIALGELACRTRPTTGESANWMQGGYDYCLSANVVGWCWFDSGVNSPDGPWLLDKNASGGTESPAPRLVKYKELLLKPTSKLIPLGGATS